MTHPLVGRKAMLALVNGTAECTILAFFVMKRSSALAALNEEPAFLLEVKDGRVLVAPVYEVTLLPQET